MEATNDRMRAIGQAIAQRRDELGFNQAELARRLGLTNHSHVSRIENGKKVPSLKLLFKIADTLDCDVSYFFMNIDD